MNEETDSRMGTADADQDVEHSNEQPEGLSTADICPNLCSATRIRTSNLVINSHPLYR